ncbi:hypothetical protein QF035_005936 [Streptomyces umbrinus]|uniref:Transposase n=1 Tax=Streptomyces umbrinus TaxID=67370 RepID=A0ABU0SXT0_9ACTN|nr:hypothetical protein [Streptomyces umbrinus]MDQ1028354.1 hypothetical protein [Streptomyces umbrinus]
MLLWINDQRSFRRRRSIKKLPAHEIRRRLPGSVVLAGLTLAPNKDGAPRDWPRRSWTSARHIRFD